MAKERILVGSRNSLYKTQTIFLPSRKADMTIADFWGIQAVAPEMNDGRGTSLVITRTEKGQEFLKV